MEEKTQTPQADEDQPAVTERGSMALERKTFVIVGQIPGGRERLIKLITDLGGHVLDSVRLPPTELKMCAQVLCKQTELRKPLNKIVKTIKETYRRGWDILSHQYVEDCAKNQSLVDHTGYLLDVTVLQTLPSRSLYSVPVVDVQVIQQQTSFLASAKKRMQEERCPCVDISNCPPPENTRTHKKKRPLGQAPSRPAGKFAMFVKENTAVVMKENPGLDAATHLGVLKNLWQECGSPTKRLMKEKADEKYKEQVERAKREMESLQPLQTDKLAFNRLNWGQIQTKE